MRDLIFVVTCVNDNYIDRMLSSVFTSNRKVSVLIVFVNQCNFDVSKFINSDNTEIKNINTSKLSLSKARNIGLTYIFTNKIESSHIMFPDDDSTFDMHFFNNYLEYSQLNKNFLINVYNEGSFKLYKRIPLKTKSLVYPMQYNYAMSVNMVVCYENVKQLKGFDENLGVGSEYGAAEDADFFIRCCRINQFIYIKELYNFHPANISKFDQMSYYEILSRFISYSKGFVFFTIKHKLRNDFYKSVLRAFLIFLFYFIKGKFRLSYIYFRIIFFRVSFYIKLKRKKIITIYEN